MWKFKEYIVIGFVTLFVVESIHVNDPGFNVIHYLHIFLGD